MYYKNKNYITLYIICSLTTKLAIWSQIGSKFDQILTTKLCHPPLSMNLSTKPARHALPADW